MSAAVAPFCAAGFLYWRGRVLLHLRDRHAPVNPNRWAFFGGTNEGRECHLDCFLREMWEETGLTVDRSSAQALCSYSTPGRVTHRAVYWINRFVAPSRIRLTEGAGFGWVPLRAAFALPLTTSTRRDLLFFLKRVPAHRPPIDAPGRHRFEIGPRVPSAGF